MNPQEFFHSFEVFNSVRPMAGTFHIVDLTLERTENILENVSRHAINHFHDATWLHIMGQGMLFCMSQKDYPTFGFSGANSISLLYKDLALEDLHSQRLFSVTSHATSFLSNYLATPVKFQGRLLEFPSLKVLSAFFLWKQVVHRRIMIHSLCLEAFLNQGLTPEKAQEAFFEMDEKSRMGLCAKHLGLETLAHWQTNGLVAYWSDRDGKLHLTLHQELPSGPDFLAFLMDAFGQPGE